MAGGGKGMRADSAATVTWRLEADCDAKAKLVARRVEKVTRTPRRPNRTLQRPAYR